MDNKTSATSGSIPKVTVAHVVTSHHMGGLERVVMDLVRGVDRDRFRSVLCCIEREGDWVGEIRSFCDAVAVFPKKPGIGWGLPFRLARSFLFHRVDVVHCHNFASLVYGSVAGRMARCRGVLCTAHGPAVASGARRTVFLRLPLFDAFVAVSEQVRRDAVEKVGISEERVMVIPNGVDVRRYSAQRPWGGIRSELGIGGEALVLGIVARLSVEKDHDNLLRAFARVQAAFPDARLLIVGDGGLRRELEARAEELEIKGCVHFLGSRSDVPDILVGMDIFVLASSEEGLPVAVLEAMAAGVPVVATAVGGVPDVVLHGETGLLVPPRDPEALAGALTLLAADRAKARAMGLEGLRQVKQRYDVSRMIDAYESVYTRLLNSRRSKSRSRAVG